MKLSIINFMVYCKGSTIFLSLLMHQKISKIAKYIYDLLNDMIKEAGGANVV